jgi:hypothetical protein
MDSFGFYLQLGFEHISNLAGYDHILFLVVLCAVYRLEQWKKILILVTAFTIGHCLTLILVSFDVITIPSKIIRFLIPLTIFITAFSNVLSKPPALNETNVKMSGNYFMALFFGLIHGMDFSNYFRALIMGSSSIVKPLFGFNIGIELGQLLVVLVITGIAFFFLNFVKVKHREWTLFISGAVAGMAVLSLAENL